MPYCAICNSRFYYQSYNDPAEPCDCGACLTESDVEDLTPEEYERLTTPPEEEDCTECHGDGEIILPAAIYGPNACAPCPVCDGTGKKNERNE